MIVQEDINDMRALINHGEKDKDEENMMLAGPPLIPATPDNEGMDSPFLIVGIVCSERIVPRACWRTGDGCNTVG